jgi:hypothetical protein
MKFDIFLLLSKFDETFQFLGFRFYGSEHEDACRSVMFRHVVRQKMTNISEMLLASIIKAIITMTEAISISQIPSLFQFFSQLKKQ